MILKVPPNPTHPMAPWTELPELSSGSVQIHPKTHNQCGHGAAPWPWPRSSRQSSAVPIRWCRRRCEADVPIPQEVGVLAERGGADERRGRRGG